ncbi:MULTISPECIES: DUF4258 domain-containing protein [unclassified Actinobaculum]|uniref:DUF4258 domain-containing protein n=1 Tax=unclassified Actinobaculum TaxID=2609299 RepID=UPI000D529587|nr:MULTISPECIES: DUF4258 domain-containing protein [unclassified Actinobaculum]AWE41820.1 hypothetical protein DDD63_02540 [Actinobaculum sp. 313]RTE50260.1 DUF4258 domain-containing protein [Actinobaculum sp. 352]
MLFRTIAATTALSVALGTAGVVTASASENRQPPIPPVVLTSHLTSGRTAPDEAFTLPPITPVIPPAVGAVLMWLGRLAIRFTFHSTQKMAKHGLSRQMVKNVINNGKRTKGNGNTSVFTSGKGQNKIRVVIDNRTGNIITITKGNN